MKKHPVIAAVLVTGAAFAFFGPLDAYAGTGRLVTPFISPTTYVQKVRPWAGVIGIAAGVATYLALR